MKIDYNFQKSLTLSLFLAGTLVGDVETALKELELAEPVRDRGALSFVLQTDQTYRNGVGQANYSQNLVTLPDVFTIGFSRRDEVVNVKWVWQNRQPGLPLFHDIVVDFTDLPGPEEYYFQFTWDSLRGISEAYLNGQPAYPWSAFRAMVDVLGSHESRGG